MEVEAVVSEVQERSYAARYRFIVDAVAIDLNEKTVVIKISRRASMAQLSWCDSAKVNGPKVHVGLHRARRRQAVEVYCDTSFRLRNHRFCAI
jgi:hypothetical protein